LVMHSIQSSLITRFDFLCGRVMCIPNTVVHSLSLKNARFYSSL
jgi:hypothetical protein